MKCLEKEIKQKAEEISQSHLNNLTTKLYEDLKSLTEQKEIWSEFNSEMEEANSPYEACVFI